VPTIHHPAVSAALSERVKNMKVILEQCYIGWANVPRSVICQLPMQPLNDNGLPEDWLCGYCGKSIYFGQRSVLMKNKDRTEGVFLCFDCFGLLKVERC